MMGRLGMGRLRRQWRKIATVAMAGAAFISVAGRANASELKPVTPACLIHAVAIHKLPLTVVLALMKTEGGRPGLVRQNSDPHRTHDIGVMQINDRTWLPEIAARDFGGDMQKAMERVRDDGCYNVMWGTEIFARYVDEAQGRYWLAVGYYNSHNDGPRRAYTRTVVARFSEVMAEFRKYGLSGQQKSNG